MAARTPKRVSELKAKRKQQYLVKKQARVAAGGSSGSQAMGAQSSAKCPTVGDFILASAIRKRKQNGRKMDGGLAGASAELTGDVSQALSDATQGAQPGAQ